MQKRSLILMLSLIMCLGVFVTMCSEKEDDDSHDWLTGVAWTNYYAQIDTAASVDGLWFFADSSTNSNVEFTFNSNDTYSFSGELTIDFLGVEEVIDFNETGTWWEPDEGTLILENGTEDKNLSYFWILSIDETTEGLSLLFPTEEVGENHFRRLVLELYRPAQ